MEDMVNLGGSESSSLQHGMLHHKHERDLHDHLREHVSLEEHVQLRSRVDLLEAAQQEAQAALDDAMDIIDKMYRKLYGKAPEEVGA